MAELHREETETKHLWGEVPRGYSSMSRASGRSSAPAPLKNRRQRNLDLVNSDTAQRVQHLERTMRDKIYQKTKNVVKRSGLTQAYRQFTDGHEFSKIDRENFGLGINQRLNLGWTPSELDMMFQRYDKDGDGVISFKEFYRCQS